MRRITSDVAFTPAVKAQQERLGSRAGYAHMESSGGWQSEVTDVLATFIAKRDSFFLGTANAEGQPYIQHRGGQAGFLKVIDEHTLAFADYTGNKQYISVGNLTENNKAFIFLMDWTNRRRIKVWGTAEYVEDDAALLEQVRDADYPATPERVIRFHVGAWDANCPQHIPRLYSELDVAAIVEPLQERIAELEAR